MTTLNDLINSIDASLHSFSGTHEQTTWLTGDIDATTTTIPINTGDVAIRGLAEIDDELVYVDSSDQGSLQLPPFGRGYRGTVATDHTMNTKVTFDPLFPRFNIKKAINDCIESLFPTLYQIKTQVFSYSPPEYSIELPTDCESVIGVKEESIAAFDYWMPLGRWQFDPRSELPNGKALNLFDPITPGADVQVTYRAKFGTFVNNDDTFASIGLAESYADLILYCVSSRMVRFLDPARLQVSSVENLSRAGVVASGDAGKIANQLYAMYQQRLAEERTRLLELDPPSINFTR